MTDETLFTTKETQFLYSKLYKFKELHMVRQTLLNTVSYDQLSV